MTKVALNYARNQFERQEIVDTNSARFAQLLEENHGARIEIAPADAQEGVAYSIFHIRFSGQGGKFDIAVHFYIDQEYKTLVISKLVDSDSSEDVEQFDVRGYAVKVGKGRRGDELQIHLDSDVLSLPSSSEGNDLNSAVTRVSRANDALTKDLKRSLGTEVEEETDEPEDADETEEATESEPEAVAVSEPEEKKSSAFGRRNPYESQYTDNESYGE